MVSRTGQFTNYYNREEQDTLVKKHGTTDKKELLKLIKEESLKNNSTTQQQDPNLTIKEDSERMKFRNDTIKTWKNFISVGGSPNDFVEFVKNGSIPYVEDPIFSNDTAKEQNDIPKPVLTFGKTITHTPKKILQEDNSLRCLQCNRAIPMRVWQFEQCNEYQKHIENTHDRKLNADEQKELNEIIDNVPRLVNQK